MKRSKRSNLPFPQEIIIKILETLPFESILTCKLVSKQLRNLIISPMFFNLYTARSSLSIFLCKEDLYCLIIRPDNKNPNTIKGPCHPPFMLHRVPLDLRDGLWAVNRFEDHKLLSGSSSGVVCVRRNNGDFLIYNLFNRASFIVADAPLRQKFHGWLCYGFGYDRYADDYKIMVVCQYTPEESSPDCRTRKKIDTSTVLQNKDNSLSWVYSVKNHVWKQHKWFPCTVYGLGLSLNGVLHWVASVPEIPNKKVIVSYDLHTCRFGEILLPQRAYKCVLPSGQHADPRIAELDGQLCCWRGYRFKLWAMKDKYWSKFERKSWKWLEGVPPGIRSFRRYISQVTPTAIYECRSGRKGVLFVRNSNWSLYWYDLQNGNMKVISKITWCRRKGDDQSRNQNFGYIEKFVGTY